MKPKTYSLPLLLLILGACQPVNLSPTPAPSPSPSVSASPSPTLTPTPVPQNTPTLPTVSASPATLRLEIETQVPLFPTVNALPLLLKGAVFKEQTRMEDLAWQVLTPDLAEIRSDHLVLIQPGKLELRAYAPSQPQLEQRFVVEIQPLPAPTPSPIPSLPPFERTTGLLGEVAAAGNYLFVTDKTLDRVHVLDISTGKRKALLNFFPDPESLAVSPDQKWVYVGSASSDRVGVIEVSSLQISSSLPVGGKVFDMVAGRDRLYVSYTDPLMPPAIFEPSTSTPKGKLPEEVPGKTLLEISPDQKNLFVGTLDEKDTVLRRVDLQNEEEPDVKVDTTRELTEQEEYLVKYRGLKLDPVLGINLKDLKISPDGKKLYLALSSPKYPSRVVVVNAETLKEEQRLDIGAFPDSLDFSPDGKYLYVGHQHYDVHVFLRESLKAVYRQPTPVLASQVTATADGRSLVGLLGQNYPNSPKTLSRFLEVSAFSSLTP